MAGSHPEGMALILGSLLEKREFRQEWILLWKLFGAWLCPVLCPLTSVAVGNTSLCAPGGLGTHSVD